jgi:hypothetical protein
MDFKRFDGFLDVYAFGSREVGFGEHFDERSGPGGEVAGGQRMKVVGIC